MNPRTARKRTSPLVYFAALLSTGSLVWTTWSLIDLLGVGWIGFTVAAGADIIWAAVIVAEYRGLRIAGKRWTVPALGWATLLAVAGFLAWHGIDRGVPAMAVAGPFLPLGAKTVWALALADMRDPAALTDDEKHALAAMERGMAFEEAQHRITMRRRHMSAELQMTEVGTDFDIELMRQDKSRELHRHRPLALDPAPASGGAPQDAGAHHREAHEAPQPEQPVLRPAAPPAVDDAPPAPAPGPIDLAGLTKAEAVLRLKREFPEASAPQLARQLAAHGIEASDGYVRTALGRARKAAEKAAADERPEGQGLYL